MPKGPFSINFSAVCIAICKRLLAPFGGRLIQEALDTTRSVGENMVELPRGEVNETRRGGVGVLELLLVDMQKRSESGYIRCEAGALGGAVGQITIREGTPSMVLYEDSEGSVLSGHAALGALQEAASLEGSQLSRHHGIDLDLIEGLHPIALLHLEAGEVLPWGEDFEAEAWWHRRQRKRRQWKRLDAWMPDDDSGSEESVTELPPLPFHPGSELLPGMVALIDTQTPDQILSMASHLGRIGHPLLVISRIPTDRLEDEAGLPASVTSWLTEKGEGENVCNATLEEVRRKIDGFLFGAKRACIVLDGLEYLTGLHGFDRSIELIRFLVDSITSDEHLLLLPVDLDVFATRERAILVREVDVLEGPRVNHWAERPARLEGHPFCSDDWSAIEIPEPVIETPQPKTAPGVMDSENRWSISGVVDAWREERQTEIQGVVNTTDSLEQADVELPEWATTPSANRGVEEVENTAEIADIAVETGNPPVPDKQPESEPEPAPLIVPVLPKGPKSPSINHRGNVARKVRRTTSPKDGLIFLKPMDIGEIISEDSNRLEKDGMDLAASRARNIEAKVVLPGEVITERNKLDFAASRARIIEPGVHYETGPDLRVIGMGAASRAAAGADFSDVSPPLSTNESVREASSRSQRTQHLTGRLAESEKASIRVMENAFSGSGGSQVTIWERLRKLEARGVEIQSIVDMFEVDPDGALAALKEAEK
ncbi:MAG: hypothetical protein CND85_02250 [Marine Group II euryarchaeote MED-G33]|nr:MAG: hypothetical protein CND85_02250 [Marine Group II euryarchaeote MED-G33]|tara:strand:+ start:1905 stop:4046 length:2142 start_codon:yes stop_codon:yes gene_type:complete